METLTSVLIKELTEQATKDIDDMFIEHYALMRLDNTFKVRAKRVRRKVHHSEKRRHLTLKLAQEYKLRRKTMMSKFKYYTED